ncbi:MAG: 30S ribosomal protein S9 [Candidatus Vogelbacteria bacterium]
MTPITPTIAAKKKTVRAAKVAVRYIEAVGRRKTSVARVRLTPSTKQTILINDQSLDNYFRILSLHRIVLAPFALAPAGGKWAISIHVRGGGIHSQAEAISLGIARALIKITPELRVPLKQKKFLTRDSRMKERRKFGLKKARKAPQWSKR